MLLLAVVLVSKAPCPTATLDEPSVLASNAFEPTATFSAPVVFAPKAAAPTAVLRFAVLAIRAFQPIAVL